MRLVSVIVATYRRDVELKRALESIANQDYLKCEIVLVDDNGVPEWNSRVSKVAQEFIVSHPNVRLKLITNEYNLGSAETRNAGISAAEGQFITFLDDDDEYLPSKISNQVSFMEKENLDYSVTDLILYNQKDVPIDSRVRTYIKDTSPPALLNYHLKYHITGTDTMMFKKEYLEHIGGFAPIDVGDEFYLMLRAIKGSGLFGYLNTCDLKAYVHTGEGGLSSGEGKIRGEISLYEFKKKYFGEMTAADVRYIKMRHYAVLAYAQLRQGKYFHFIVDAFISVLSSPASFFSMIKNRRGNNL